MKILNKYIEFINRMVYNNNVLVEVCHDDIGYDKKVVRENEY